MSAPGRQEMHRAAARKAAQAARPAYAPHALQAGGQAATAMEDSINAAGMRAGRAGAAA
ncbi:hypothetical protein F4827_000680 [Paraburkholderia bannensis]|uniref:Uncharacterized protein n=1 Tax=Paraburkholderia bannensis TaxID=765414 RepID=A0A7W9TTN7_9BURK|nr:MULTISPECIES: hypothetical protein [Paraburkholderia]MBB3255854.1 hypothetical protein [Paraburkholderia sp. WP4_3_2]MBB6100854.1 hypothetical protein [Paraburkholderia bannensis]